MCVLKYLEECSNSFKLQIAEFKAKIGRKTITQSGIVLYITLFVYGKSWRIDGNGVRVLYEGKKGTGYEKSY